MQVITKSRSQLSIESELTGTKGKTERKRQEREKREKRRTKREMREKRERKERCPQDIPKMLLA